VALISGLIGARPVASGDFRLVISGFWLQAAPPLLNALALVLALSFRRNRAVLVLIVLTLAALALSSVGESAGEPTRSAVAMRMFAPWLFLAAAAMPERGLLAARNLVLFLLIALAVWLTLGAPVAQWTRLSALLPFGVLPWSAGSIAAGLTIAAACVCAIRWVLRATPIEGGLAVVLTCVGIAFLPVVHVDTTRLLLACAGVIALIAVVYSSYRMAFVDALSGLPNRRALDETLSQLSGNYAVAMVDIDHFKKFNDAHGHDAGDRVLKSVAQSLRRTRGAHAFRYGGEEFCLLFTGTRSRNASEACENSRERIENERVRIRSTPSARRRVQAVKRNALSDVRVTVSIGVAERDAQTRAPLEVLKIADQALYRAKSKGRNRVVKA
jgi:diguanylate cyclase (GGDEF)-like protein